MLRTITWLIKLLSRIFLLFIKPLKNIWRLFLKIFILPLYNLLHLAKKQTKDSLSDGAGNKTTLILTNSYLFYFLGFLIFISVLINNLLIKNAAAEDLAKKSIFYQLAAGDEFEAPIEDDSLAQNSPSQEANLKNLFNSDSQFIDKNSSLEQEKTWLPEQTDANDNLAFNALIKDGASKTSKTEEARIKITEYTIESGDTLYSIAKKFNISLNTVLWANKLTAFSTIRPGNKLMILPVSGIAHQIKKGDTISAIAKKYNVTADKILTYNQIISDDQLTIGQNLIVPGGEIKKAAPSASTGLAANLRNKSNESNTQGFIWPTTSRRITQYYSWRHPAIDIGGPMGSPIYAARAGKITKSGWGTGYGNYITIDHSDGTKTLYSHMSKLYAKVGEQVEQGAVIGAVGSTGWSTGPHVHFEIIINGKKINPLSQM